MADDIQSRSGKALKPSTESSNSGRSDDTSDIPNKNKVTSKDEENVLKNDIKEEITHNLPGSTSTTMAITDVAVAMETLDSDVLETPVDALMGLGDDDDEGEEGEDRELSHQEAMAIYQKSLAEIIQDDPLLCDLATTCTLEEVKGRVALEHGQAMGINVVKDTAEIMAVFVVQNGTVHDLKRAIRQHVTLHLERNAIHKPISWRHIWKSYWLYFEGQKLEDDRKKLKDYGIKNKAEVLFLKRLRRR